MQKKTKSLVVLTIGALLGVVGFASMGTNTIEVVDNFSSNEENIYVESVELIITTPIGETNYFVDEQEGKSIFDIFQYLETTGEFSFELTEQSEENNSKIFALSLNGYKAVQSQEYWRYSINGEEQNTQIFDYILNSGDKISFNIENLEINQQNEE